MSFKILWYDDTIKKKFKALIFSKIGKEHIKWNENNGNGLLLNYLFSFQIGYIKKK